MSKRTITLRSREINPPEKRQRREKTRKQKASSPSPSSPLKTGATAFRTPSKSAARDARNLLETSCLLEDSVRSMETPPSSGRWTPSRSNSFVLRRALSFTELGDSSWLSSSLIDLVFSRFAKVYRDTLFLSTDFLAYRLVQFLSVLEERKRKERTALASRRVPETGHQHQEEEEEEDDGIIGVEEEDDCAIFDILGHPLSPSSSSPFLPPLVCMVNVNDIHWNLVRVQFEPIHELQIFEPMGKASRGGRYPSFRDIPRELVTWLDEVYPLYTNHAKDPHGKTVLMVSEEEEESKDLVVVSQEEGLIMFEEKSSGNRQRAPDPSLKPVSWLQVARHCITHQQQLTGFDCGVACLLYAEKAACKLSAQEINEGTTQGEISGYRTILQEFARS